MKWALATLLAKMNFNFGALKPNFGPGLSPLDADIFPLDIKPDFPCVFYGIDCGISNGMLV